MKKFLRHIAFLIIIIFATDKVLSSSLDIILKHSNFRWVNVTKEIPQVYIVGNSRGVNSVNESLFEKELNLDILNLSYNGMSPNEIEYILNYTDKNKLHVFEISSFLAENVNESKGVNRFDPIKDLRQPTTAFNKKVFQLLNFNNELTLRLIYYIFKSDKNWSNNGILTTKEAEIQEKRLLTQQYNLERLKSFLDYLNKNGFINVKFYLAPMHPKYISTIENFNSFNEEIDLLLGNNFLSLANLFKDNSFYADLVHNNRKGARLIHEQLYTFMIMN